MEDFENIIYDKQFKIKLGIFMMLLTKLGFIGLLVSLFFFGLNMKGFGVGLFLLFPIYKYFSNYKYYDKYNIPFFLWLSKMIKESRVIR